VDVRLLAATNRDLEKMVREKTFREDLYYRLNVMRIRVPSLRDRLSDVPELVDFMLQRLLKDRKSRVNRVSAEALQTLARYNWPGNVRELENTIQRSAVVAQGDTILKKDLPQEVLDAVGGRKEGEEEPLPEALSMEGSEPDLLEGQGTSLAGAELPVIIDLLYERLRQNVDSNMLQEMEKELLVRALKETGGNQVKTSTLLGITRATLRKRIESYGLTE